MTFEESIAYMSGLIPFGVRLNRERFVELLHRLGDPHTRFRCVHVAGTNGKGSTTTFTASVLKQAGYKVGAYLSPYVFDVRERILVGGKMIGHDDFARHVTAIRPHIEAIQETELGQTTEFELKTAVAFRHFAEQQVDFAVVEVGIGGRLDATNVIPPPLVAVITSIGWDHTHLLGDTLAKIAREKAGIVKRGTLACVTAVPPGEALEAIAARCAAEGVPLLRIAPLSVDGSDDGSDSEAGVFATYEYDRARETVSLHLPGNEVTAGSTPLPPLQMGLRGPFQAANATTAAAALDVLRKAGAVRISDAELWRGLEQARLPGRFQITRPASPDQAALVLDVAHNEDGARVLADALRATFGEERRFVFVVGMKKGHEPGPFLEELVPLVRRVVATAPPFRPKPAAETADAARQYGLEVTVCEPAARAIVETHRNAHPSEVVVVTGSFYTVGETPLELR